MSYIQKILILCFLYIKIILESCVIYPWYSFYCYIYIIFTLLFLVVTNLEETYVKIFTIFLAKIAAQNQVIEIKPFRIFEIFHPTKKNLMIFHPAFLAIFLLIEENGKKNQVGWKCSFP